MNIDQTLIAKMKRFKRTVKIGDIQMMKMIENFYVLKGNKGNELKELTRRSFELIASRPMPKAKKALSNNLILKRIEKELLSGGLTEEANNYANCG